MHNLNIEQLCFTRVQYLDFSIQGQTNVRIAYSEVNI